MPETITSQGPKSVPEILNAAASLLEKQGAWTQGSFYKMTDDGPCMCAMGAIAIAGGLSWDAVLNHPATKYLAEQVSGVRSGFPNVFVAPWNDAPGRTQSEVVAALRDAASKSESPNV